MNLFQKIKLATKSNLISAIVLFTTTFSGCGRSVVISPDEAFRAISPANVAIEDDLDFVGLAEAIKNQRNVMLKGGEKEMRFGAWSMLRRDYWSALAKLLDELESPKSKDEKLNYIRDNFTFLEWYGGARWGEILLTGYFEPIIPGSLVPTPQLSQPIYAKPSDLITVDLRTFSDRFKDVAPLKGRIENGSLRPYFSRHDIDSLNALQGRSLELCWVDPTDAFFLHIQGSGTIRLPKGDEFYLTYAEKNGLAYTPIGKALKERIAPLPVTMQRIEEISRRLPPDQRKALFALNPSYVFFKKSRQRALTALGIPATPGRTIAADSKYAPKGAIALITFSKPHTHVASEPDISDTTEKVLERNEISRFVLHQDSGGAITGTDHVDLFWGRGDSAKEVAGALQDRARIVFLLPKQ